MRFINDPLDVVTVELEPIPVTIEAREAIFCKGQHMENGDDILNMIFSRPAEFHRGATHNG